MEVVGALAAEPGAKQQTYISRPLLGKANLSHDDSKDTLVSDSSVRRLTPLECERLQGFPDQYTNIPGASDSGRYKALGNAMAVPVMAWIGRRIQEAEDG